MNYTDTCFVLRTIPFRERDVIASLFSETHGRFSGIARNGVQSKRFGGSLNLFTASDFEIDPRTIKLSEITQENLVHIQSAQVRHAPDQLSKSFEKLSAASCLNEIVLRVLPEHKPAPDVFKLYSNSLVRLNELESERAICLVNAFILKITQWLGVQPSLTRCANCEKALNEIRGDTVFPQVNTGSWLCMDCAPGDRKLALLNTAVLDAYHSMLHPVRKIEFQATPKEHEPLLEFLEKHLQYFVPGFDQKRIESLRFLKAPNFTL